MTHYAIILPICNEEACLDAVLDELIQQLPVSDDRRFTIAVGLNDTSDRSGEIARSKEGIIIGETDARGYGQGCVAAIEASRDLQPDAYIFYAGDGASDPADLPALVAAFESGAEFVHGTRTSTIRNWRRPWRRIAANVVLGIWTTMLCRHLYLDLGPYRIISRELYERMNQQELTWGWTIESQILAARLGASIAHVPVDERKRIAGQQKVSGVSWRQTLEIGKAIAAAGFRVAHRPM
ncbi:MAG: glycosyltransferase [Verrucomicrobiota bacterium]